MNAASFIFAGDTPNLSLNSGSPAEYLEKIEMDTLDLAGVSLYGRTRGVLK